MCQSRNGTHTISIIFDPYENRYAVDKVIKSTLLRLKDVSGFSFI